LALGAVLLSAGVLNACGGGVPSNAVARVGDATISKASFDHWLTIANNSSAASAGTTRPPAPDPPNFVNCVSYLQKTAPKPPAGQSAPTVSQLKAQCQTQYSGLRDQVMQFLVSADWLQGEASDQGVKVSSAQVNTTLNQLKAQQFPSSGQFQQFLATSGMTMQDLLFRVRLDALSTKIRTKVTGAKGKVTPAQISAYYNQNRSRFGQPERRDLRLILTHTPAQAAQALAALHGGQSFSVVAKRFSTDPSKAQGGALTGVTRGTEVQALDTAIFSAAAGKTVGPIKTPFGYYIFRVQKVTRASQQTLQQATPTIQQALVAQQQQSTLTAFVTKFNKKWKSRTTCRTGYVIPSCSNAPKSSTTTTPGSTGSTAPPPQSTTTG
jgi:foldase protein PrsA